MDIVRHIIDSYSDQKVVFLAEQDQFYREQCGVMEVIQKKFYNAPVKRGKLIYEENEGIHIAVHIRRGDVVENSSEPNIQMRWLNIDYYYKVLEQLLQHLEGKSTYIYIFSQGQKEELSPYLPFDNICYCLDMGVQETFWHLTQADILVISRSSFSYKPALLSSGIIVAPKHFWHAYPDLKRWTIVDEEKPEIDAINLEDEC